MAENATRTEQSEATIVELNRAAQQLRSQLSTTEQALSDSTQRAAQLQRSLADSTNRNCELTEQIGRITAEGERLQNSLDLVTRDNARLLEVSQRYDTLRASSRIAEKQSKVVSKNLAIARDENLSLASQLADLQARIAEFEDANKSLSSELDSQAAIADDEAAENEKLRSKVKRLSSKLSAAKAGIISASAAVKDLTRRLENAEREKGALEGQIGSQSIAIQNAESDLRDTADRLAKKEVEVGRLTAVNRDLQEQIETANANVTLLESKGAIIEDLNNQLRYLRNSNEALTSRNSKLEKELRETAAQVEQERDNALSKASLMQHLQEENSELAGKIAALEDGHRDADAAVDENRALLGELEAARKENRHLNRTIRKLSAQIEELQRELNGANMARMRKATERAHESDDITVFLNDIERALAEFEVGGNDNGEGNVSDRLQAIWSLIQRIREVFEEQKQTVERMSKLTTSQHNVIMKLSRESFGERSPR
jgi:chromosome segregation ATPase